MKVVNGKELKLTVDKQTEKWESKDALTQYYIIKTKDI